MRYRRRTKATLVGALCAVAAACTVGQKRDAVALATRDADRRAQTFEATLRLLDEKPEYVDEFFHLAADRHPATLGHFLRDTVGEIDRSKKLTDWTATELARQPRSLEKVLVATLDAADPRTASRQAIADAIAQRPKLAARALAERPEVALEMMKEMGAVGGSALAHRLRAALGE